MKHKPADRHARSNGQGQGMNWLRPVKRISLYLRDGLACVYCQATLESEARLTLDHLKPYSLGGDNSETNLVTCCLRCNSARGNRPVATFAKHVAAYINHGVTAKQILAHIAECTARELDLNEARAIIARRGNFSAALASLKK